MAGANRRRGRRDLEKMRRSFAGTWALLVPSSQAKPERAGGQENRVQLHARAYSGLGVLGAEMVQPRCDHITCDHVTGS